MFTVCVLLCLIGGYKVCFRLRTPTMGIHTRFTVVDLTQVLTEQWVIGFHRAADRMQFHSSQGNKKTNLFEHKRSTPRPHKLGLWVTGSRVREWTRTFRTEGDERRSTVELCIHTEGWRGPRGGRARPHHCLSPPRYNYPYPIYLSIIFTLKDVYTWKITLFKALRLFGG